VFALSTTPKTFFHEALAHHQDGAVCQHPDEKLPCFHRQTYHCAFDDLVVTAPYLATRAEAEVDCPIYFVLLVSLYQPDILPAHRLHKESRGPPAA
ncbi:MAG TPA: hypothetical protein VFT06_06665, partial [Flavisolibacter sp.]|nr:hypothetical protein [Flavisolibacter sp.]